MDGWNVLFGESSIFFSRLVHIGAVTYRWRVDREWFIDGEGMESE